MSKSKPSVLLEDEINPAFGLIANSSSSRTSNNKLSTSRREKETTRNTRLSIYQTEPVREGNFLVQASDHPRTEYDSQASMNEKMEEIMRCFEQTHLGH